MMIAWPIHRGLDHLFAGEPDLVEPFGEGERAPQGVLALGQAAQTVLDDDHRAVDDEAEVDGPQAHEVAADAGLHHAGGGHQHRERNGQGGDQRRPDVAQQQEEHDDDQDRPLGQVFLHGA